MTDAERAWFKTEIGQRFDRIEAKFDAFQTQLAVHINDDVREFAQMETKIGAAVTGAVQRHKDESVVHSWPKLIAILGVIATIVAALITAVAARFIK